MISDRKSTRLNSSHRCNLVCRLLLALFRSSGAGVLGMFIMGAMTCSYVSVKTNLAWTVNETTVELQSILDRSIPGFLPLGLTLLIYWLFAKKEKSPTAIMVGILVVALIGAAVGFF